MKNLLALLAVVVIALLVIGYFQGWYNVVDLSNSGGTHRLQIDVDTTKIRTDIDKGKERLRDTFDQVKDAAHELPRSAPDGQLPR